MNATASVPQADRVAAVPPPRRFVPSKTRLLALWPAVVAVAVFLGLMAYLIVTVKAREGGRFVYPLDDTYGHLATAKNLVEHGTWSYNAVDGFESSVSSLLWPLLIAVCFAVFGVHEYIPLVLNILAMVAMLFYAAEALRRLNCPGVWRLIVLLAIIAVVPMCAVASVGMEHSLQLLLTLIFVDLAARLLMDGSESPTGRWTPRWLCVTGVLLVMTRYEGLFLIAAVGLLLLLRKRWKLALVLGAAAVTPVVLFGLYSLHKGWYFVPNSLMIKGNTAPLTLSAAGLFQYFRKGYDVMMSQEHVPPLVLAAVVALLATLQRRRNLWTYPALVLVITLLASAQQFQFASLGWFYRYEAYLIMLIVFAVGAVLGHDWPEAPFSSYWRSASGVVHALTLVLAVFLFGTSQWPRMSNSYPHIVSGSYSIYGQQYQMGRFVRQFYKGKGLILNDICAVSFMGEGNSLLDIAGLSDIEVLRLRRTKGIEPADMRRMSEEHHARIAIVYDSWIKAIIGGPLPEWVKVGTWTIPNNTVSAGDTVAFYATSPEYVPELQSALQQFSPELPKDVRQEGLYRGAGSLNPLGVYGPPGGPEDAHHYWTLQDAQFWIFPATDEEVGKPDTDLNVTLFTINENQTVEVYFNGELVLTKVIPLEQSVRWISVPVKVKWQAGRNTLKVVSHGNPVVRPGDPRPVLFAVLDPRRMLNADSTAIVAQPGVVQAQEN